MNKVRLYCTLSHEINSLSAYKDVLLPKDARFLILENGAYFSLGKLMWSLEKNFFLHQIQYQWSNLTQTWPLMQTAEIRTKDWTGPELF